MENILLNIKIKHIYGEHLASGISLRQLNDFIESLVDSKNKKVKIGNFEMSREDVISTNVFVRGK
jgi:hypothetical protein